MSHMKSNPFSGGSRTRTIIRLVAEVIVFLLWVASAVMLLRKRDGCGIRAIADGQDRCWKNAHDKSHGIKWTDHPTISYDLSIAFSFVEM